MEQAKDWTPKITRFAMESVHLMIVHRPIGFELMARQSWYRDGVDIDEAVFIGALESGVRSGGRLGSEDTFFEDMLRSHDVQKRRVDFPLAGEVTVWVVKHRPFERGENLAGDIGAYAKEVEAFFGQPFPAKELIVVVAEGNSSGRSKNLGDHIFFNTSWPDTNILSAEVIKGLNGYYLRDRTGRIWLTESVTRFIEKYPDELAFGRRESYARQDLIDYARSQCFYRHGINNIQDEIDFEKAGRPVNYCVDILGELFAFRLFEVMGWDAMGKALGDIYVEATSIVDDDNTIFSVSEEKLYESFTSNAPRGSEAEVRALYESLHGGRFLYPVEAVVDFDALPEEVRGPLLLSTKWRDRPDYDVSSKKYLLALGALSEIWMIDEELAYDVSELLWVHQGVNHLMTQALTRIGEIAVVDLSLARHLVDSPAMDNSRAYNVRYVFDAIQRLTETDVNLAWEVARSQWVMGDWTDNTSLFLQALADFGAADAGSVRAVLRTRWVTDGLTGSEPRVIEYLRYNVQTEPRLLEHLMKYDWLAIGARSRGEPATNARVLEFIAKVAEVDGDLAVELSKVGWMQDNIANEEYTGIGGFLNIALLDVRRAKDVVMSSWFQRRMTIEERSRLDRILDELWGL